MMGGLWARKRTLLTKSQFRIHARIHVFTSVKKKHFEQGAGAAKRDRQVKHLGEIDLCADVT